MWFHSCGFTVVTLRNPKPAPPCAGWLSHSSGPMMLSGPDLLSQQERSRGARPGGWTIGDSVSLMA